MNQAQYEQQQQQQQQPLPYQWSMATAESQQQQQVPQQQPQDVCQTGFVEHCLVQANADGEQRLMLSLALNRTGNEQMTMASEFDGMCHVVVRFIDCLNQHYVKCSPVQAESVGALGGGGGNKDIFLESWTQLCSQDGSVRKSKCFGGSMSSMSS